MNKTDFTKPADRDKNGYLIYPTVEFTEDCWYSLYSKRIRTFKRQIMKTGDVIGLVVLGLIFLSLIDRWFFRKLVIISRTKMDNERFKLEGKSLYVVWDY
jgi:hypothetical protein